MRILRLLLLPFSLLYGLGVALRNAGFLIGILKEHAFDVPVISVGNLSTGGTGKSPHVLYLAALLSRRLPIVVLSRGYGRSGGGFRYVTEQSAAAEAGDEALQLKRRLPEVTVAVAAGRRNGITRLLHDHQDTRAVLLDDAFQHRYVRPGLSILLFDCGKVLRRDFLLPAGNLREWPSARYRADIVVVTKCPDPLPDVQVENIREKLKPGSGQKLYFSTYEYLALQPVTKAAVRKTFGTGPVTLKNCAALIVTGIADASGLLRQAQGACGHVQHLAFPDHHRYGASDGKKIAGAFDRIGRPGIVITTEKDAMRLAEPAVRTIIDDLPLYYWSIRVKFTGPDKAGFDREILEYAGTH